MALTHDNRAKMVMLLQLLDTSRSMRYLLSKRRKSITLRLDFGIKVVDTCNIGQSINFRDETKINLNITKQSSTIITN